MTWKFGYKIIIVFIIVQIVIACYYFYKSYLNYSEELSEANNIVQITMNQLNKTTSYKYQLDQCILLLLNDMKIIEYLHNINSTQMNRDFYYYNSFYQNPYHYNKLGKSCVSIISHGQNNDLLKKYDDSCFVKWNRTFNRTRLTEQLKLLTEDLDKYKIDYWLCSGSVIGSYRYHGIIPYDDDIDFYLNTNDKSKAKEIFNNLSKNPSKYGIFKDTESSNQHWKFGVLCNNTYNSCIIQIDFFFFWVEFQYLKFLEKPGYILKSYVYPLVNRPFEGMVVKTPNNFPYFIKSQFNENDDKICRAWNHNENAPRCILDGVDCDLLRYKFPYLLKTLIKVKSVKSKKFIDFDVELIVDKFTITGIYVTNSIK